MYDLLVQNHKPILFCTSVGAAAFTA